jgi:hypothetical protein
MELFDEVKNRYFHSTMRVLNESINGIDRNNIIGILDQEEFQEKVIGKDQETFLGLMVNEYGENQNYNLLRKEETLFYPTIKKNKTHIIPLRFASIEKQWIKSLMEEPNIKMVLSDNTILKLKEALKEIDAPIASRIIHNTNTSILPEINDVKKYKENFKVLLKAIIDNKAIRYCNTDRAGNKYENIPAMPIRLEYSHRDGRFRVSMYLINENRIIMANIHTINNLVIDEELKSQIDRE